MTKTFYYPLAAFLALALLFPLSIAFAEDGTTGGTDTTNTATDGTSVSPTGKPEPRPLPTNAQKKERVQNQKAHMLDKREDVMDKREDVRDHMEDVRDKREDVRDAMHNGGVMDKREDVRDRMEDIRDKREDVRDTLEDRREKLKERGLTNASDRIVLNLKRFIAILEAGANRMTGIIERIESHMEKLGEDVDTTEAERHIEEAKESLRAVYVKIGDIKGEAEAVTPDTARDTYQKVKELLREAREDLKNAAQSIRNAVKALKEAAKSTNESTTDTSSETGA